MSTAAGDFFVAPLPEADVITMGMILHDWNLERKKLLIRKAYDALPPGGAFVAIEALIDGGMLTARRTAATSALGASGGGGKGGGGRKPVKRVAGAQHDGDSARGSAVDGLKA